MGQSVEASTDRDNAQFFSQIGVHRREGNPYKEAMSYILKLRINI